MSEPKSHQRRLIGVAYWAVWGWAAAAVGLCAATATWIDWDEVLILTLIGLPIMMVCGVWSAVLLGRSAAADGRRRSGRLISVGGAALVALSGALAGWTVCRILSVYGRSYLDNWRDAPLDGVPWWGWGFTTYQLVAFAITVAVVLAVGWLVGYIARRVARRTSAQRYEITASRLRLAMTLVLGVALLPAMMFGGYESSRRLGMAGFVLVYERSARATAARMQPLWFAPGRTPRDNEARFILLRPTDEPGPFAYASEDWDDIDTVSLWSSVPTLLRSGRIMNIRIGESNSGDNRPEAPADAPETPWYPLWTDHNLWNGWKESGESLTLAPPWRPISAPFELDDPIESFPCWP